MKRLRHALAEEQLSADGVTYIRLDLVLDLRLASWPTVVAVVPYCSLFSLEEIVALKVNSFNSLSQWDLVVDGVLLTDAGRSQQCVADMGLPVTALE